MAFFHRSDPIQQYPEKLVELFNQYGWETTLDARLFAKGVSGKTNKYIKLYCFKCVGSDNVERNFGFVHTYGGKTPTPLGEEEIISQNSILGELVKDNVDPLKYHFKIKPITTTYLKVFKDGVAVAEDQYTVDPEEGIIIFNTVQGNSKITANYGVHDNAPDKPRNLWFFLFEELMYQRLLKGIRMTGSAGTYVFSERPLKVKEGALKVYHQGSVVSPNNYDVLDWNNLTIKFKEGFQITGNVTVDCMELLVPDDKKRIPDIEVDDFDINDGKDVFETLYSTIRFNYPTIPTAYTIIDEYTGAWTRNSLIDYWGNITLNRIVMYSRIDPTPDPVKAYYTPLYIGRVICRNKHPKLNNVIFAGSNEADEVPVPTVLQAGTQEIDYGVYATNGNEGVLLFQNIGGIFSQKHYLAFITHDDKADFSPESKFNPSVYTDFYHISPIHIVHPHDGYVGVLDEVYAVHPRNINQNSELEVKEDAIDEQIGVGDGKNRVFHLQRTPKPGSEVIVKVGCTKVPFTRVESQGIGEQDEQLKKVVLDTPPPEGAEVYATYRYEQTYMYNLATTPRSPLTLETTTPYAPIGMAFLKENKPFD